VGYIISDWTGGMSIDVGLGRDVKPAQDKKLTDWVYSDNSAPVEIWKATIPSSICNAVDVIPDSKIEIIAFASNESTFADLLMSNPHLAWLSYGRFRDEQWSINKYMALIAKKQHNILKELGFPSTRSVAKILRSYSGCPLTSDDLHKFMELLGTEIARIFFVLHPNLYYEQIAFLLRFPHLLSVSLGHFITTFETPEILQPLEVLYTCESNLAYVSDFEKCSDKRSLLSLIKRIKAEDGIGGL
tara:strand:+ start:8761 stop:9492 length:732 start_codon:yes stop_codon:yes gene_type:complete